MRLPPACFGEELGAIGECEVQSFVLMSQAPPGLCATGAEASRFLRLPGRPASVRRTPAVWRLWNTPCQAVIAGVAAGRSNKVIAADMGIKERTVESHLRRMYDRYDVLNRIELLTEARRSGLNRRSMALLRAARVRPICGIVRNEFRVDVSIAKVEAKRQARRILDPLIAEPNPDSAPKRTLPDCRHE